MSENSVKASGKDTPVYTSTDPQGDWERFKGAMQKIVAVPKHITAKPDCKTEPKAEGK